MDNANTVFQGLTANEMEWYMVNVLNNERPACFWVGPHDLAPVNVVDGLPWGNGRGSVPAWWVHNYLCAVPGDMVNGWNQRVVSGLLPYRMWWYYLGEQMRYEAVNRLVECSPVWLILTLEWRSNKRRLDRWWAGGGEYMPSWVVWGR